MGLRGNQLLFTIVFRHSLSTLTIHNSRVGRTDLAFDRDGKFHDMADERVRGFGHTGLESEPGEPGVHHRGRGASPGPSAGAGLASEAGPSSESAAESDQWDLHLQEEALSSVWADWPESGPESCSSGHDGQGENSCAIKSIGFGAHVETKEAETAAGSPSLSPARPARGPSSSAAAAAASGGGGGGAGSDKMTLVFSIKVLAFTRAASLARLLRSLSEADYLGHNVSMDIFVDGNRTAEVSHEQGRQPSRRLSRQAGRQAGRKGGRQTGRHACKLAGRESISGRAVECSI